MKVTVSIKKLSPNATIPVRMTPQAAGYDIYAANEEPVIIGKGKITGIPTGIAISLPEGYEAQIRPRSGLALKHGIGVLNSPGTIDADYRGEIRIILFNYGEADFLIEKGMRIAQMVVARCAEVSFNEVVSLDDTTRGSGGFGYTG